MNNSSKAAEMRKNVKEVWQQRIKPDLELLVITIAIGFLYLNEFADTLAQDIEKKMFPKMPKLSKAYAYFVILVGGVASVVAVVVAAVIVCERPWRYLYTLNEAQINALLNLILAAMVGGLIIVAILGRIIESIQKNGLVRTILSIAILITVIKGLSVLLAWMLTLNFGISTPELDEIVRKAAMLPEVTINKVTQELIPWVEENIHIFFN